MLLVVTSNPIKALTVGGIDIPDKIVASIALVTTGAVCGMGGAWFKGRNYSAEELQKKIELIKEQKQRDAQQAQGIFYEVKIANQEELRYAKNNTINKEALNKAALRRAHQTAFPHVHYSRLLESGIEEVSRVRVNLPEHQQEKAERKIKRFKQLLENNNSFFKSEIAQEIKEEQKATAEQMQLDYKIAAQKEAYNAKKKKTEFYQNAQEVCTRNINAVTNQAQQAIATTNREASAAVNLATNAAHSMHSENRAQNLEHTHHMEEIKRAVKAQLDEKGINARLTKIENAVVKNGNEEKNQLENLTRIATTTNDGVNDIKRTTSSNSSLLNKVWENVKSAVGQQGTTVAWSVEPSAPPMDY